MKRFLVSIVVFLAAIALLASSPVSTYAVSVDQFISQTDQLVSDSGCDGQFCDPLQPCCKGAICIEEECRQVSDPDCVDKSGYCSSDQECCYGLECIQGECSGPDCKRLGEACSDSVGNYCCSGATCANRGDGGPNVCSYCSGVGDPCGFTSSYIQCCDQLVCEHVQNSRFPGKCIYPF